MDAVDWDWWLGAAFWTAVVAIFSYHLGRSEMQRSMIAAGWRLRVRRNDGTELVFPEKDDLDATS